jgi:hypothetical protein
LNECEKQREGIEVAAAVEGAEVFEIDLADVAEIEKRELAWFEKSSGEVEPLVQFHQECHPKMYHNGQS